MHYRLHQVGAAASMLVALVMGHPTGADAQDLAMAERGPRFLFAATSKAAPQPLDIRSAPVLRKEIGLHLDGATLPQALAAITRETGLEFVYGLDLLPAQSRVNLRAEQIAVAAALTQILLDTGLDVLLSSSHQAALVRRVQQEVAQPGSIVGRVTDAKMQTALAGATVVVEGTPRSATTGSDGRYRIAGIAPGTYTMRARYIGYAPGTASVTVSADQDATADFGLEKSAQRLDEVVTTGTVAPTEVKALPTPISIISDSEIALQHPHTVQELFRQAVPTAVSWDFPDAPYQTSFSVRGATTLDNPTGQMKVFVDGIEAASASYASIDPNSIEHIEVIRGPQAAAVYGSDAIGGVIQVFTKRGDPNSTRPHVDAQAAAGMIQTPYAGYRTVARQTYAASMYGGGPAASYNFGAGYSRTPDYAQPQTAQSNPSAYGGLRFARGIVNVDVSGRYYLHNTGATFNPVLFSTGASFFSKPYFLAAQNQNDMLGAQIGLAPIPWWRSAVVVGISRYSEDDTNTQPRFTTPDDTLLSIFTSLRTKTSIGYNTSVLGALGVGLSGSLTAGVDHYSLRRVAWFGSSASGTTGDFSSTPTISLGGTRTITNSTGYFAQGQLNIRDALFLTGGIRADQNTDFGSGIGTPVSPRVGLSYVQSVGGTTLKLRGSWGRGIRAPNPGEKSGSVSPGNVQLANPDLGPERQHGWDAGADAVFGQRGTLGITYFDQIAENLIDLIVQPTTTGEFVYQFQNVGRVRNRGVEVEATLSLGPAQARAQYGYVRARVEQLAPGYGGDLLPGDQTLTAPKHTAGGALTVSARKGTTISAGVTYVGSWNNYDFLTEFKCFGGTGPCGTTSRDYIRAFPGFVKMNATIWQQVTPAISGFVSVDNLTNRESDEDTNFDPVFGRITTVGVRLQY